MATVRPTRAVVALLLWGAASAGGCASEDTCNPSDPASKCGWEQTLACRLTACDGQGAAASSAQATPPCNPCFLYPTTSNYCPGNAGTGFTSVAGADGRCMSDGAYPGTGTYKALIVDNGFTRVACTTANCSGGPTEHLNWSLYASTVYRKLDMTTIMTTNANGIFVFGTLSAPPDTVGAGWYTGLSTTWTYAGVGTGACTGDNWSSPGGNATYGLQNVVGTGAISSGNQACGSCTRLLCAQQ